CKTGVGMELVGVGVRLKPEPAWKALLGASAVSAGTGLTAVMVKVRAFEAPPPGAGLTTVTEAEPAVVRSLAGMLAVSWVVLTKVVVRGLPFHCTTDAAMKEVQGTVYGKGGPLWRARLVAN